MPLHKYEGKKIKLERDGETVKGVLVGSQFGPHYNAKWEDSNGQGWIGLVSKDELEQVVTK